MLISTCKAWFKLKVQAQLFVVPYILSQHTTLGDLAPLYGSTKGSKMSLGYFQVVLKGEANHEWQIHYVGTVPYSRFTVHNRIANRYWFEYWFEIMKSNNVVFLGMLTTHYILLHGCL
jgi:hypothetical protein